MFPLRYGVYHTNKVNKIIHVIFVPLIVFSFLGFFEYFPLCDWNLPLLGLRPNVAYLLLPHLIYFLYLDSLAGIMISLLYAVLLVAASKAKVYWGDSFVLFLIGLQLISWTMQFIGHGLFEGRRPAIADNILQAVAAPFFVTMEIMFILGYKPAMHAEVQKRVNAMLKTSRKVGQRHADEE